MEEPVWLVRTVFVLFLVGFGIYLTFEVLDFTGGLLQILGAAETLRHVVWPAPAS